MKFILLTVCAALLARPLVVHAQEATDVDLPSKQTSPTPSAPPNIPELAQLDEMFKKTSMGKAADAQQLRIEWRQLKNQVVNDPDLVAAKRTASTVRTDLEKRELLRAYYRLYYVRIRRFPMTAEMKAHINAMEAAHFGRTAQPRVRPSPEAAAEPH